MRMQMKCVHYQIINFIFTMIIMIELILLEGRVSPTIFISQYNTVDDQVEEDCSKSILKTKTNKQLKFYKLD